MDLKTTFRTHISEVKMPQPALSSIGISAENYVYHAHDDTYEILTDVFVPDHTRARANFKSLRDFDLKISKINGEFYCGACRLESLIGGPDIVMGQYDVSNNLLSSLDGVAKEIHGNLTLSDNRFTSLRNSHKHLSIVTGNIYIIRNEITSDLLSLLLIDNFFGKVVVQPGTSFPFPQHGDKARLYKAVDIINNHLRTGRSGVINAQTELIEAGLENFAHI